MDDQRDADVPTVVCEKNLRIVRHLFTLIRVTPQHPPVPGQTEFPPYRLSVRDCALRMGTDPAAGLSVEDAVRRLREVGPNRIERRERRFLRILGRRIGNAFTLILVGAVVISLIVGETADAVLISIVVLLDLVVGLFYESYTQYRIELIQKQVPRIAEVIRGRQPRLIPVEDVVPGDLVVLRGGERVPADLRLTRQTGLRASEAVLTGEPGDVAKLTAPLDGPAATADQRNMVFAGTTITTGSGHGIAVATGPQSLLGSLARRVLEAGWQVTPLEVRLKHVGQLLGAGILLAAALLFLLGVARGETPTEMFRSALTLSVAAIPEDLTFILTLALAVGASRLLSRRAVARHLTAAETLGDATIVATDKTGTLTTGELSLRRVEGVAESWNRAAFTSAVQHPLFHHALTGGVIGTTASAGDDTLRGSALERALQEAAVAAGLGLRAVRRQFPLFAALAFDPRYRYAASLHDDPLSPDPVAFIAGAPEALLPRAVAASDGTKSVALTDQARANLLERAAEAAAAGTRVLAVCTRHLPRSARTLTHADVERLTFLALLLFDDPVRPDAIDAVRGLQGAGVRVMLVTGDHRGTAEAVARATGILRPGAGHVLEGAEVERLSDRLLIDSLRDTGVIARVDPLQKERIIAALQKHRDIVAMIGDGVNDAVALRRADLGVAVSSATDVAKDASDLVLLDGGLKVLTDAVWEGRRIRETVRTVLAFLFSTNLTELLAVGVALALGVPFPFLPAQLLWINVVTDGSADVALALEPASTRPGDRTPARKQSLFSVADVVGMLFTSVAVLIPTLVAYLWALGGDGGLAHARTVTFVTLAAGQLFTAFSYRSLTTPLFRLAPFGNPWLLLSIFGSFGLLVAAVHWQPLATLLGTVPLSAAAWGIALVLAAVGFIGAELRKFFLPLVFGSLRSHPVVWTPRLEPEL